VVAIIITAIVLAKVITGYFSSNKLDVNTSDRRESLDNPSAGSNDGKPLNNIIKDSDTNKEPVPDAQLVEPDGGGLTSHPMINSLYNSSPIVLPITWGAVAGTLIWKGKTKSQWRKEGYDYDTFRLVVRMRGSSTRIRVLNAILDKPKNKLQLAKELGVDWKTVDNHVRMLMESRLIEEKSIDISKCYLITENGRKVLSLLSNDERLS